MSWKAATSNAHANSVSSTLRHRLDLTVYSDNRSLTNQIAAFHNEVGSPDLLFIDFNLQTYRSECWQLEALARKLPCTDIVVCFDEDYDHGTDLFESLEEFDNVLFARVPLAAMEVRQLVLLVLKKRQIRSHLGKVCQEREEHLSKRTYYLRSALDEARRLLSSINQAMVEYGSDFKVRRWNAAAAEAFGLNESEVIGKDIRKLSIPWDQADEVHQFLTCHRTSAGKTIEASFRSKHHDVTVLSLTRHTIHHPDEPDGVLLLGTDLTEQRQLQQHLQQALRLESVGQLAAGVAHEINTPMQYIGDNIDFLSTKFKALIPYLEGTMKLLDADGQLSEQERTELQEEMRTIVRKSRLARMAGQIPDAFSDSQQGLRHVTRIVRAMKELSHPGDAEISAVNINHLLETAVTISTNEWKYIADVDLNLTDDAVDIPGFPGELCQVFLNLIINASHAIADVNKQTGRTRGAISIRTERLTDDMLIEIRDNGGGIPDHIADRVFDPFFTTKEVGKGTGQGLAIAHSVIVQKHGGKLTFHATKNTGTNFIIHLPIDRPSTPGSQDE